MLQSATHATPMICARRRDALAIAFTYVCARVRARVCVRLLVRLVDGEGDANPCSFHVFVGGEIAFKLSVIASH